MALHSELPIYKVAYDLLALILQVTRNMPRDVKQQVGTALRDVLQSLANEHGVRVTDVRVEWQINRMVSVEQPQSRVKGIQIVSESL